jgi:hypothetical protein
MVKKEDAYAYAELRERLKEEIEATDKTGSPGQRSARKMQFLTKEDEKSRGGDKGEKTKDQKNLRKWIEEEWSTQDRRDHTRSGDETALYLSKEGWRKPSSEETEANEKKKREGSKEGKQYVENAIVARQAHEEASLPIEDYDDLTVEEAKKKLEGLLGDELMMIRSYEKKHKNRKTLLQELDRKLADGS